MADMARRADDLWLDFVAGAADGNATLHAHYREWLGAGVACANSSAASPLATGCAELAGGLSALFGTEVPVVDGGAKAVDRRGMVVMGADAEWPLFSDLSLVADEAFAVDGRVACGSPSGTFSCASISSPTGRGALYGAFRLLMLLRRQRIVDAPSLRLRDAPRSRLRMWQLWDNVDGTIERGYAGRSVYHYDELPGVVRPRYAEYARLLASVGLNAISLTNVNACGDLRGNSQARATAQ